MALAAPADPAAVLRDKLHLAEETIDYLRAYRYGAELVKRIAEAVK